MSLSIVMAARNDFYGGREFRHVLNRTLRSVAPIGCEIIVVEWNPPVAREPLWKVIETKGVRVITVPPDVHNSQHGADLIPMFEYRAKNVGIRRATGDWVLCVNSDIELHQGTRDWLAEDRVDPDVIYRAMRHDVHLGTIVQVCDGPGDFVLMHRDRWMELTGYLDLVTYTHLDSLLFWNAKAHGLSERFVEAPVFHEEHDRLEHKARFGIHSSDMPHFIGIRNEANWGLMGVPLPERTT